MPTNAQRLQRVQAQLGIEKFGVYLGVYTSPYRAGQFESQLAIPFANMGPNKPDYVFVKVGEWGIEWYDGTFADIRAAFLRHGIGCVPYFFARPQTWQADAAICAKVAKEAGIVVLDCEEQWLNNSGALVAFVAAVRNQAGDGPVIIVSGYGDPQTAVPGWDFAALAPADAYQPQWYIGYWNYQARGGVNATLAWGDGQCYNVFVQSGLGADFPIQPAINVEGVSIPDIATAAHIGVNDWKCSVAVWEARDITAPEYAALASGSRGGTNTPTPSPTPPQPQPGPPQTHYTVVAGDTLSSIAAKFHVTGGWQELYTANRAAVGSNPNDIHPGLVLVIP